MCLKMLCTPTPNGFADHYPYYINGYFIGNIYPIFRQTHMLNGWDTLSIALFDENPLMVGNIYIGNMNSPSSESLPPNHWIFAIYMLNLREMS